MGLARPGAGRRPCQSSAPDLAAKAGKYESTAPVNTSPPAVTTTPLTSGVPQLKAMPSGALSSAVPTVDCHRILPALRSSATITPQGGLLQGMPTGDITS